MSQEPQSQGLLSPTVTSAADGIFAAFRSHPLVGLGDNHGLAQEEDFCAALIRDKRFAEDVGNVVVEFGDAAQQDTLYHYLAGEDVPYDQLRKVWSNTAGWIPTVASLGYINFYAQVRVVNLGLPPCQSSIRSSDPSSRISLRRHSEARRPAAINRHKHSSRHRGRYSRVPGG